MSTNWKGSLNFSALTTADKILHFYQTLSLTNRLPKGVRILNPYLDETAFTLTQQFYRTYYDDQKERRLILGINPGRFGGGLTGIPFTDPIQLEVACSIPNTLEKRAELSATFIYRMIQSFGGPSSFYSRYLIGSLSPLGFTLEGKNLNYYDSKSLEKATHAFIIKSLKTMLDMGIDRSVCYCLGEGKNFDYLTMCNNEHQFFQAIVPLPHPRFIMQYKRKQVDSYIKKYLSAFEMPLGKL